MSKQKTSNFAFSDPRSASDAVYLKKELDEMDDLYESHNFENEKSKVILRAAEMLKEKYPDSQNIISSILCKFWATDLKDKKTKTIIKHAKMSRSYLLEILPPQYKREYKKKEKKSNEPANLFEEAIRRTADICKDLAQVYNEMYSQVKEMQDSEDAQDHEILTEIQNDFADSISHEYHMKVAEELKKQMSEIGHLDDYIIFLKETEAAVISLKHLFDKRRKFSTAAKIILRMIFQFKLFDDVAKKLNSNKKYGAKWLGTIKNDPHLSKFIKLTQCPNCQFDFDRWIEDAEARHQMGLEPQLIDSSFCVPKKKKKQ